MPYQGNPAANAADAVRFWAQDTGATPLLSDDEVQYLLTDPDTASWSGGRPRLVASAACRVIIAKYSGQRQVLSADGVSMSGTELSDKYRTLAQDLIDDDARVHANSSIPAMAADCPQGPLFAVGQFDNPEGYDQIGNTAPTNWDIDDPADLRANL